MRIALCPKGLTRKLDESSFTGAVELMFDAALKDLAREKETGSQDGTGGGKREKGSGGGKGEKGAGGGKTTAYHFFDVRY